MLASTHVPFARRSSRPEEYEGAVPDAVLVGLPQRRVGLPQRRVGPQQRTRERAKKEKLVKYIAIGGLVVIIIGVVVSTVS